MRFAAIDPGTLSMGVAIFEERILDPESVYLLTVDRRERWDSRIPNMIRQLAKIFHEHGISQIYCEQPSIFVSAKGKAATNTNSTLKLSMLVGAIAGYAVSHQILFNFVRVIDWKGQLSKSKVISRIKKLRLNLSLNQTVRADIWDAIGIGLYTMGSF